jgi:hypothetical protein
MKRTVIITRHSGLVEYLRERHPDLVEGAKVLVHVTPEQVRGAHVIGVLPLHLAALAASVTEVPLALTPEDRAAGDLPVERVRKIAGEPVTYTVLPGVPVVRASAADGGEVGARLLAVQPRDLPDGKGLVDPDSVTGTPIPSWRLYGDHVSGDYSVHVPFGHY